MFFKTFHINNQAPPWVPDIPFEGQSNATQAYYLAEFLKLRKGIHFGNVRIHPWLYYHVNYFNIMIDQKPEEGRSSESEMQIANLRDNEWFINQHLLRAERERQGIMIFGTRRAAKTAFISSYTDYNLTFKKGGDSRICSVMGGNANDLNNIISYAEDGLKNVHPAFSIYPGISMDWYSERGARFGWKDKQGIASVFSVGKVVNLGGDSKQGQKGAGATPNSLVMDEVGKFNSKHHFDVSKIALFTPYGWRTVPVLLGTSGDKDAVLPAKSLFLHPKENGLITMDWSVLDDRVAEKTWESGKECGLFMPAQCSLAYQKRKTNLSAYLKIDDPYLEKIEIEETPWEEATKDLQNQLAKLKKIDRDSYDNQRMHLPLCVDDCFAAAGSNPFPVTEATEQRLKVEQKGTANSGYEIELEAGTNKLILKGSNKELAVYPHPGGNIDAPVQIFEAPPQNPRFNNLYVAGLDHYKQDKSDTDSVGTLYILKRMGRLNDQYAHRIVASLATRPASSQTFNKTIYKMLMGYGAVCLQEAVDQGFEQYVKLRHKGLLYQLLAVGRKLAQNIAGKNAGTNVEFGLFPSTKNKKFCFDLVVAYAREDFEIINDKNETEIVKGVYLIDDVYLLDEMINYSPGNNVDRITAFGHALAWAHYLDSLRIMPNITDVQDNVQQEKPKPEYEKQVERSVQQMQRRQGIQRTAYKRNWRR